MQIKDKPLKYLKKPVFIVAIKAFLFGVSIYFIAIKFSQRSEEVVLESVPAHFWKAFLIVVFMMLLNWMIEAVRWKVSNPQSKELTFKKSVEIVLAGLALNWVLPFSTGDFFARVSQQLDKYAATSALVLNRGLMFVLTLLLGCYSILTSNLLDINWLLGCISLALILLICIFLWRRKLHRFVEYFRQLSLGIVLRLSVLSISRYLIFLTQFVLLIWLHNPHLGVELMLAGIGWVYLSRSILPVIAGGVGVREATGILFFDQYVDSIETIVAPIFLIWVINVVIPSGIGLLFIWRLKVLPKKSG